MIKTLKDRIYRLLRWSEQYTKTDMHYLFHSMSWLSVGQTVSSLSSFLIAVAFANLVDPVVYGTYKYVLSVIGTLAVLTLPGINISIVRSISRGFEKTALLGFRERIRWGTLLSFASIGIALFYYFNNNTELAVAFLIPAAFAPLMEALNIYDAFLQGKKNFKALGKYRVLSVLVSAGVMVATISLTDTLWVILFSYFLPWTLLRYAWFKISLRGISRDAPAEPEALSFGRHVTLMRVIETVAAQLDKILIFQYLGAFDLALYAIATAPPDHIKAFFKNAIPAMLPKFASRQLSEIQHDIGRKARILFVLAVITILLYVALTPFLFSIFFPKYTAAVTLSRLYSLSLLGVLIILPSSALLAHEKTKKLYILRTVVSIVQIFLLFLFVSNLGLIGVVYAQILTRLIETGVGFTLLRLKPPTR